jgi:hypothetical protein
MTPVNTTTHVTCAFDSSTATMTCEFSQTSSLQACSVDTRARTSYASVSDFITEPRGATRASNLVQEPAQTPTSCPGGGGTTTTSYTYDGQKRLLQSVTSGPAGPALTTSNVAWDAQGRPTMGSSTFPGGPTSAVTYTYNDAGMSYTQTVSTPGAPTVVTTVDYDADGLALRSYGDAGGFASETTYTTMGRAQVCQ